jgi:2-polyprenyl-3-methyl-5-hydroxy-6-metoxy-1,4-benzoquinol methylase
VSFQSLGACWVCGGTSLRRYHEARLDLRDYIAQDPELAQYTGQTVWLVRCAACGHGQPERLPTLPRFFDRVYDQRWGQAWIEREFEDPSKDFIFRDIMRELRRRVPMQAARLLDVGAHAGRFMALAKREGWSVEGIEVNARTAAYAARRTSAPVHQVGVGDLAIDGPRYSAVTVTDVLEHIPDPVSVLAALAHLVEPGGWVAIKVPSGRNQEIKERVLAALTSRRVSLALNLVHVNHFSVRSLTSALERAGFIHVAVRTGAPELPRQTNRLRAALTKSVRLATYAAGRMPGAMHTPLGLNLQAFAAKPAR